MIASRPAVAAGIHTHDGEGGTAALHRICAATCAWTAGLHTVSGLALLATQGCWSSDADIVTGWLPQDAPRRNPVQVAIAGFAAAAIIAAQVPVAEAKDVKEVVCGACGCVAESCIAT